VDSEALGTVDALPFDVFMLRGDPTDLGRRGS